MKRLLVFLGHIMKKANVNCTGPIEGKLGPYLTRLCEWMSKQQAEELAM